jgi:SAM-dependent methyltransferase
VGKEGEVKPSQHETERRESIGGKFISGRGFEIGAGEAPSEYDGIEHVTYIDKRSQTWLEERLGGLPYQVTPWGTALQMDRGDFFIAHHVIEHQPDPVGEFRKWLGLLVDGGRFFISLPSPNNVCEKDRLPTPIEHILDDYVFNREYESRQHAASSSCQRFVADGIKSRYFRYSAVGLAQRLLREMKLEDLDCHFHTFTLEVMKQVIEAACHLSDLGVTWLHAEENDALYLVGIVAHPKGSAPHFLVDYRERLRDGLYKTGGLD